MAPLSLLFCLYILFDSKGDQPVTTEASPVLEPLQIGSRLAEELQLHLLELTGTERKVTRCDLVTERLSDLTDSKRNLLAGCSLDILEVYKNTQKHCNALK